MAKSDRQPYLTDEAVAAFRACDYMRLHAALGLTPWHASPLPEEIEALGCTQDPPPDYMDKAQRQDWRNAQKLQRELLAITGWPNCRKAYEENLREAEEWVDCHKELVDHPDRDRSGTGCSPEERRAKLKAAEVKLAWRRKLLAELDGKVAT